MSPLKILSALGGLCGAVALGRQIVEDARRWLAVKQARAVKVAQLSAGVLEWELMSVGARAEALFMQAEADEEVACEAESRETDPVWHAEMLLGEITALCDALLVPLPRSADPAVFAPLLLKPSASRSGPPAFEAFYRAHLQDHRDQADG